MNTCGPLEPRKLTYLGPPKVVDFFAAVLVLSCFLGCQPSPAQLQFQQAADHLNRGDYSLAREHFSQVLELNPRSAAAYLGRGKCQEGLAALAEAVDDYKRARELQPDLAEAKERLIVVLVEKGDGREALALCDSAPPETLPPALLLARGRARLQVDLASESLVDFDGVLKQEPQNISAHYFRGLARVKLGDLAAAEQDFSAAISRDASHSRAYWQRGLVWERQGKQELAASDRQKAVELDPRLNFAESQIGKNMMESLTGQVGDDAKLEPFSKGTR